jgi:chaperonin cofactor prefoldin
VTTEESQVDVRAELERVEREIAELRPQIREIRERLADPGNERDRTEMLTMAEEQEAILAVLEQRAETLRQRLQGS